MQIGIAFRDSGYCYDGKFKTSFTATVLLPLQCCSSTCCTKRSLSRLASIYTAQILALGIGFGQLFVVDHDPVSQRV